ncbi:MAG: futalosine hydrolase [Desulfuromonadales bacterium]|nr:futalosine hydrolase [Desulfuromonadales bacterium]
MIALLAAVPKETELLRRWLSPCEVRSCGRRDLLRGSMFGQSVALLHSGVGKANAASALTSLLESSRFTLVLGIGCGGAYPGSGLAVGDLALASEEIYGDEGVLAPDGFLDMQELGFPLVQRNGTRLYNRFPVDPKLLEKVRPVLESFAAGSGCQLRLGPFVTVSTGSGTDAAAQELAGRTGGICENMEGAALAQVCALQTTPFLSLRGISNPTGNRDLAAWDLVRGVETAQLAVRALFNGWNEPQERA